VLVLIISLLPFIVAQSQEWSQCESNTQKINDYNIETGGGKATAMLNLVKELQAENFSLTASAWSHIIVREVPAACIFISNWEQFTALGVEVTVKMTLPELDIRMTLPATAALAAQ